MKVILLKDIKGTGKKGDIINVSDGHGRNYLLPRGLAKEATDSSVRELSHQQASMKKKKDEELAEAKELAKKLSELRIVIKSSAGEGSKLFGSITSKDIVEKVEKDYGITLDKKKVQMKSSIKMLGTYEVEVKVYPKVKATLNIKVEEE